MNQRGYQRRHLRAPFREVVLFRGAGHVLKGRALNLSGGGLLLDELPSFPEEPEVPFLLSVPKLPALKNFGLLKMQTFNRDMFQRTVVRVKARLVRREELSRDVGNIFQSKFGLEFTSVAPADLKVLEDYVGNFASNLIHLQTLIDSFNSGDEVKAMARVLAGILGYREVEKIALLRAQVGQDYRGLQWL